LLEGLEISEISYLNITERFDSEFNKKKYLAAEKLLRTSKTDKITELGLVTDGNHLTIADNYSQSEGIRYLRGQDIASDILQDSNAVFIPATEHDKLKRSHIFKDDILLTIVGANTGNTALVVNPPEKLTANCKLGIVRPAPGQISSHYLHLFLASKYGQLQVERHTRGGGQTGLILPDFRNLDVVRLSNKFELLIDNSSKQIYNNLYQSRELYSKAEGILLEILGLQGWTPRNNNYNLKSFKESFLESNRLDGEFYQPKFDELEAIIKSNSYSSLDSLCSLINHGKQPPYVDEGEIRVFSQKWIDDKGINYDFIESLDEPRTSLDFANQYPDYVCKKYDILHYSVGANIGYCHTYLSEVPIMPGSFITLIRAIHTLVDPVYLGVVLNSLIGRLQSEKRKSGSAQPYIYPSDLKRFLIPIIDPKLQLAISTQVVESYHLRMKSKYILQVNKKAIEIAIEKDELSALKFIAESL